jgi:hypothetical protein
MGANASTPVYSAETADTVVLTSISFGNYKNLYQNENYRQSLKYSGKHTYVAIFVNCWSSFLRKMLAF